MPDTLGKSQPPHAEALGNNDLRPIGRSIVDDEDVEIGLRSSQFRDHGRQVRRLVVRGNEPERRGVGVARVASSCRTAFGPMPRRGRMLCAGSGERPASLRADHITIAATQARSRARCSGRNSSARRIAKAAGRADAGRKTLTRERQAAPTAAPPWPTAAMEAPASAAISAASNAATAIAISSGCTIIASGDTRVAGGAPRMLRDEVDAAVSEPVLLNEVAGESVAPPVHAARVPAERQAVAGVPQTVAHVVVVAVAERSSNRPTPCSASARYTELPVHT